MMLTFAFLALISGVLIFLRYSFWRETFCRHLPGKKTGFFNLLGDVSDIWKSKDVHQGLVDLLKNRMALFKKEQLFCLWLAYEPVIVLKKAEAVKELLVDYKMNEKSWLHDRMRLLMGSGLITSEGEKWKTRRKLLIPCFHLNVLKSYLIDFNEGAGRLVTALKQEAKKDYTLISDPIKFYTLDILCETIFGVKINNYKAGFSNYIFSMKRITELLMENVLKPWQWPSFIFLKSKSGKEFLHHVGITHQVTRKIIREKKELYLKGETNNRLGKQKALMDLLMQKHFETRELSEEDIREEVDTFAVAGHETTATSITWALYLIGIYPDVQAKLYEEIDRIFGGDIERQVTDRDLQDLEYLDCVLKESNRIYSTVPVYVREASENIHICGYLIPKGTSCAVGTYLLHKDEDVFPEPEAFKPERFMRENIANIPAYAYCPFSAGPRMCIGYKFAEM